MTRYVYKIDEGLIMDTALANVSLIPDSIAASNEDQFFIEFVAPLSAYEKDALDEAMLSLGYHYVATEDAANGYFICIDNRSIAVSPMTSLINGIGYTEYWPYNYKVTSLFASVATAGSTDIEIDILINGVSIFDTDLTIDAGSNTNIGAAVPYVITNGKEFINQTDKAEIDVVSNGTDAAGLVLTIMGNVIS